MKRRLARAARAPQTRSGSPAAPRPRPGPPRRRGRPAIFGLDQHRNHHRKLLGRGEWVSPRELEAALREVRVQQEHNRTLEKYLAFIRVLIERVDCLERIGLRHDQQLGFLRRFLDGRN